MIYTILNVQTRITGFLFSFLFVFGFSFWGKAQNPDWKWQNPQPTGNHLFDVQFIDNQTGWAVGEIGTILKTTNGGQTWQTQTSSTTNDLHCFHFSNAQNGWAVGRGGTILHTSTGGVTPIHKTLVSEPSLSIYPNPASQYIHLNTQSPVKGIEMFDMQGNLLLPFGKVGMGLEDRGLDISSLKPGIYWLRVQTAEGISTQKVVKE